jgi:hypothetical protein
MALLPSLSKAEKEQMSVVGVTFSFVMGLRACADSIAHHVV